MSIGLEIKGKAAKSFKGLAKLQIYKLAFKYVTLCTVRLFRSLSFLTDLNKADT